MSLAAVQLLLQAARWLPAEQGAGIVFVGDTLFLTAAALFSAASSDVYAQLERLAAQQN